MATKFKYTTFFIVALLLLLSLTQSSARPEPAAPKTLRHEVMEEASHELVEEGCEGVGEEECLVRRTLTAHVDYIYTQGKKP